MDTTAVPSKISRVDIRYRHRPQIVSPNAGSEQEREAESEEKEEELLHADAAEPLLIREQKGRAVMGRAHRLFHRHPAQDGPQTLTVNVQVVATIDASGNAIPQETVTEPIASVPTVASVSLPSVPSVPPFPSDLTVPAYPWPSGVSTASASQTVISSPAPTSTGASITNNPTTFPSTLGFNSTSSSTIPTTSSFLSTLNSTSTSTSSSTSQPSSSSTRPSTSTSAATTGPSSAAASTSAFLGGGGGPGNTAAPSASPTAAVSDADSNGGSSLDTPKVVGSVVGSLAGVALLLALILFLLKRHKKNQRAGALQLTGDDHTDTNQPMTQPAAVRNSLPSFLNRFSGASRSTAETSMTGGERGFQRVSGRKLPSAFSEGLTSEQFERGEGTLSGSSFYKDDKGLYAGSGAAMKEFGKETGESSNAGAMGTKERIMPSPARTPVVHHSNDTPPWGTNRNGGGSTLSPPLTPNPDHPPRGTLGRSHPSHDGSRSSRFTENV